MVLVGGFGDIGGDNPQDIWWGGGACSPPPPSPPGVTDELFSLTFEEKKDNRELDFVTVFHKMVYQIDIIDIG